MFRLHKYSNIFKYLIWPFKEFLYLAILCNIYFFEKTKSEMENSFGSKTNASAPEEIFHVDTLMTNPGFSHIARNISLRLDHESQLRCRLVCQSWKANIDQPFIWILKCDRKGQSKSLHDAWVDLFQDIEKGSTIEEKAIKCLMQWHRKFTKWAQKDLAGITPIHIAAFYRHTELVKFLVPKIKNFNTRKCNGWAPIDYAARWGYLKMFKFLASKIDDFNAPNPT